MRIEEAVLALLQILQYDMLQFLVGEEAERIVNELEEVVLKEELGAVLSSKQTFPAGIYRKWGRDLS